MKTKNAFIRKIAIQNYKSIGRCSVELRPLTMLVGLNGSGKSNFLDALRFVADALRTTLEHALRDRGGISEVRRRSRGHPTHLGNALDLNLADGGTARYAFRIGAFKKGGFVTQKEECRIHLSGFGKEEHFYSVEEGQLKNSSSDGLPKKFEPDRLYLQLASGLPEFRRLYDLLSHMGFYNLNPDRVRDLQDTDPGELLLRYGRNISGFLRRMKAQHAGPLERITDYLRSVVPGIVGVEPRVLGPKETLEFKQRVAGDKNPWTFLAANMSDGTLRALSVLVAIFQARMNGKSGIPLIGIEEPETAIHPGAAVKLMDALLEAQRWMQLVVTTHSPDLLNHPGISSDNILAVANREGETLIAPVDQASVRAVQERLYTVGELLRLGQIEPDEKACKAQAVQLDLFHLD